MPLRAQPSEGCASASFATSALLKQTDYTEAIPTAQRESNSPLNLPIRSDRFRASKPAERNAMFG